jgi:hypothetical protein
MDKAGSQEVSIIQIVQAMNSFVQRTVQCKHKLNVKHVKEQE